MKIVDVRTEPMDEPAVTLPWRDGLPRRPTSEPQGFLVIETDDGVVGRAHTTKLVSVQALVEAQFSDELVGRDPLARELLWQRIWEINRLEYMPTTVVGLVDIALWDIAGQSAGLPVHRLMGGYRDRIPAYASTVTFGSVEEYLDVADQCLALGYTAIKLHAWGDARRDAELSQALRDHVGPTVDLMFDGSAGWDLADAVYVGRALAEARYLWYEEPMKEYSIGSYRRLGAAVDVPLLVAEVAEGAHWTVADFISQTNATYVRTSAGFKGGLTGALRVAHLADSFQLRAEVHGGGLPNEHLCMAIPNTTYYESLVVSNPVRADPRLDSNADLVAPDSPGLGWRLPG
ncbi:mandelate racemase family protein [Microlunatus panaciterrae]|uniref:L-alanine-DL-glutamate epimerase-like enolase superfamily enzyme n=1 Tax=Microlunatus panaciterrae TaxID=400768 RepID=A0ABS2RHX3_9ACTN|nr:enolase C-terminal domain-like protein [Microlunatus panaciterrae]MBM7798591.1 L-alanine-DL-glutamate epimerase-like enolase superfamily enzyme [Microlunatus panaciterrae]